MSPPLSDDAMKALTEALRQGRKIDAIKIHREITGLGLKESKDAIEAIESSLRAQFPDKFPAAVKGKGCFGAAAGLFIFGATFSAYWFLKN
jgi:hypothetical protein